MEKHKKCEQKHFVSGEVECTRHNQALGNRDLKFENDLYQK